jgi:hypothetical protein
LKIKSLASLALSLTFVSPFLIPIPAQATDGCDIFTNSSCQFSFDDGWMHLTGRLFDFAPSLTLSSAQSLVEFRLISPSATWLSQATFDEQKTDVSCRVNDSTRFRVAHSTAQGVSSEVFFDGQRQAVASSITPHGEHTMVVIRFQVPETANLVAYSCSAGLGHWSGGNGLQGDAYDFTLNLSRTFTPSTPTPTPSASTQSKPTPTASASPRGNASPSPSASAEATNEEDEVETRSSEVVVLGNAESQNDASPIGFFLAGTLSALAGVGATVAFIQRKAIIEAFAKLKKLAKP